MRGRSQCGTIIAARALPGMVERKPRLTADRCKHCALPLRQARRRPPATQNRPGWRKHRPASDPPESERLSSLPAEIIKRAVEKTCTRTIAARNNCCQSGFAASPPQGSDVSRRRNSAPSQSQALLLLRPEHLASGTGYPPGNNLAPPTITQHWRCRLRRDLRQIVSPFCWGYLLMFRSSADWRRLLV
jgi:hypothetical protein